MASRHHQSDTTPTPLIVTFPTPTQTPTATLEQLAFVCGLRRCEPTRAMVLPIPPLRVAALVWELMHVQHCRRPSGRQRAAAQGRGGCDPCGTSSRRRATRWSSSASTCPSGSAPHRDPFTQGDAPSNSARCVVSQQFFRNHWVSTGFRGQAKSAKSGTKELPQKVPKRADVGTLSLLKRVKLGTTGLHSPLKSAKLVTQNHAAG
jgi:hypothetical protein